MLKMLAVFAVILVIMQALVSTPGRASGTTGNISGESENRSQDKHDSSAPKPALVRKPIQPSSPNPNSDPVGADKTEHTVRLSGLPPITLANPITIADKHKPWWDYVFDWGPWIFALGLVAIGVFQTRLLIRQEKILHGARKEIHTQARHMSRQADLLGRNNVITLATARAAEESAKAANAQIQMMKDRERARIHVTPLDFEVIEPAEPNKIMIEFVNIGPTNAFDVRVEAGGKVTVGGLEPQQGEYTDLAIPTLLRPDKAESSWVVCDFPQRWQNEVVEYGARITIELVGQIKYRDVFDTVHIEDFSYRMNVYGIENMPRDFVRLKPMRTWHPFDLHPSEWKF
jgi:hypothetical protein